MYLVMSVETSGLMLSGIDFDDPAQPWVTHCAAIHCLPDGRRLNSIDKFIWADGRTIKPGAEKANGITTLFCQKHGLHQQSTLIDLAQMAKKSQFVISWGMLPIDVVASMMLRLENAQSKSRGHYHGMWIRPGLRFINIQAPYCQNFCKIPNDHESGLPSWPTLDAAGDIILGEPPLPKGGDDENWLKLQRVKRLFFWLKERKCFKDPIPEES